MLRWTVVCCALLVLVCADDCPDGGRCKNGQTCCSDPANGYKCCPFHQAECCEDHVHCCPEGTNCDTATSSCVNATASFAWARRTPAQQQDGLSKSFRMISSHAGPADDHMCPDGSRCPPEFSCLKSLRKFVCCPLAEGVACSDGKHCCPEGHRCSANSRSCIKEEFVSSVVLCPDKTSKCPDGSTCCINPSGVWGCCPLPKAVCCEDKLHCCPEGTVCDLKQSKCISSSTKKEMPMWAKLPARKSADWENQKKNELGRAEYRDSEKVPELTAAIALPHFEKKEPVSLVAKAAAVHDVPCNDSVACPDKGTCCKSKRHGWRCCSYTEGVCCADSKHCCPKGHKCARGRCVDDLFSVPLRKEMPTIPDRRPEVGDVPCDSTHSCPDNYTCCKLITGDWGCCGYPQAVCCSDKIHCCPHGYTCNLATSSCDKLSLQLDTVPLVPLFQPEPRPQLYRLEHRNIQCDEKTNCHENQTCCKTSATTWGCCPAPHAVCCKDMKHCCPAGFTCSDGACVTSTTFFTKNTSP